MYKFLKLNYYYKWLTNHVIIVSCVIQLHVSHKKNQWDQWVWESIQEIRFVMRGAMQIRLLCAVLLTTGSLLYICHCFLFFNKETLSKSWSVSSLALCFRWKKRQLEFAAVECKQVVVDSKTGSVNWQAAADGQTIYHDRLGLQIVFRYNADQYNLILYTAPQWLG